MLKCSFGLSKPRPQRAQNNTFPSFLVGLPAHGCACKVHCPVLASTQALPLFSALPHHSLPNPQIFPFSQSFQFISLQLQGKKSPSCTVCPHSLHRHQWQQLSLSAQQRATKRCVVRIRGWHFALARMLAGRTGPRSGEKPQKQRKTQFLQISNSYKILKL